MPRFLQTSLAQQPAPHLSVDVPNRTTPPNRKPGAQRLTVVEALFKIAVWHLFIFEIVEFSFRLVRASARAGRCT